MTEKTYIERTTAAIEALESALRTLFKADATPPIPYAYNGVSYDIRDRETRMLVIAAIQNAYYRDHGEFNQYALDVWYAKGSPGQRPTPVPANAALLDRLTDAALYEEITDPNPHKVTHTEYPFMSERQLDLRRDRETSASAAEAHGADGKEYRAPTKRARTPYEKFSVDAGAKIRNAVRAARYKRDTAPGAVVKYNVWETGGFTEPFVNCVGVGERWLADMGAVNEVTVVDSGEIYEERAAA